MAITIAAVHNKKQKLKVGVVARFERGSRSKSRHNFVPIAKIKKGESRL